MIRRLVEDENTFFNELVDYLEQERGPHLEKILKLFLSEENVFRLPSEVFSKQWKNYRDCKYVTSLVDKSHRDFSYDSKFKLEIELGNVLHEEFYQNYFKEYEFFSILDDSVDVLRARRYNPRLIGFNAKERYPAYQALYRLQSFFGGYEHVFLVHEFVDVGMKATFKDKLHWQALKIPALFKKNLKGIEFWYRVM